MAEQFELSQGGVLTLRADQVQIAEGGVCLATGDSVTVSDAMVGIVVGRNVKVESSRTLVLLANSVEGDVHTVLNRQSALAFGAAAGLVCGLLCFVRGLLSRR